MVEALGMLKVDFVPQSKGVAKCLSAWLMVGLRFRHAIGKIVPHLVSEQEN
jgi:hypothetical protein